MEATAYLDSLNIPYRPPAKTSVGRLTITCEFLLDDLRGVIVRPRRKEVSGRYLDLLAAEGFRLVVIDTQPFLQIYARTRNGVNLEQIRALPIREPDQFPSIEVFRLIADLMRSEFKSVEDALAFGASLLAEKLDDEQRSEKRFSPDLVSPQLSTQVSDIFQDANAFPEGLPAKAAETLQSFRPWAPVSVLIPSLIASLRQIAKGKGPLDRHWKSFALNMRSGLLHRAPLWP